MLYCNPAFPWRHFQKSIRFTASQDFKRWNIESAIKRGAHSGTGRQGNTVGVHEPVEVPSSQQVPARIAGEEDATHETAPTLISKITTRPARKRPNHFKPLPGQIRPLVGISKDVRPSIRPLDPLNSSQSADGGTPELSFSKNRSRDTHQPRSKSADQAQKRSQDLDLQSCTVLTEAAQSTVSLCWNTTACRSALIQLGSHFSNLLIVFHPLG